MLQSILRLARLNLQIAWCRRGPQDLPAVGILLPIMMGAYVLISLAVGACVPLLRVGWTISVVADTAFLAAWYWLLLALFGRRERYLQTASAIFGLQSVLAAPAIAGLWMSQWRAANPTVQSSLPLAVLDVGLMVVVMCWTLVATGQILRAALERSPTFCWALAFAQMLMESIVLGAVYPG